MKVLRTISTPRLLGALAGLLIAVIGGTAIAFAAVGSGPMPPRRSLAGAIHTALAGPAVPGISARVTFTDHLIDASAVQGSDPLLSGGSGRLWLAPGRALRLEVQSDNGDAQLVVTRTSFWAYDPAQNTVFEGRLPAGLFDRGRDRPNHQRSAGAAPSSDVAPSLAAIRAALARASGHVSLSGAIPSDVAGQPAYTVRVTPADRGGLIGGAELAFDAIRGVPLRFALYARGDGSPVIELTATGVSYGPVPASVFAIAPPSAAKVVHVDVPSGTQAAAEKLRTGGHGAVHWGFHLDAPTALAGLPRTSIEALDGGRGAVVTYGHGLGALSVIEHPGTSSRVSTPSHGEQPGLSLPSVSINGATAQELPTALGTIVQFSRTGIAYTVIGSVTRATAERAARGL